MRNSKLKKRKKNSSFSCVFACDEPVGSGTISFCNHNIVEPYSPRSWPIAMDVHIYSIRIYRMYVLCLGMVSILAANVSNPFDVFPSPYLETASAGWFTLKEQLNCNVFRTNTEERLKNGEYRPTEYHRSKWNENVLVWQIFGSNICVTSKMYTEIELTACLPFIAYEMKAFCLFIEINAANRNAIVSINSSKQKLWLHIESLRTVKCVKTFCAEIRDRIKSKNSTLGCEIVNLK